MKHFPNIDEEELQRLYWVYHDAKRRCESPAHKVYDNYGGRGIKFLFSSFVEWLTYMGERPLDFEMDRIDNNGHYVVGNLRWTDRATQQKNKRIYKTNTSGVRGVSYDNRDGVWVSRCNNNQNGKRDYLYVGKDFFEACCTRLSWENSESTVEIRNRRGKGFERDTNRVVV